MDKYINIFIDFKTDYDSVMRTALYNNVIEYGIYKKLNSLIKMYMYGI